MKQFIKQFAQLKKELPEAVFAANDLSAIGAVEALMDSKIRVPEQVSVAGCDDIEIARLVRPSITTVRTSLKTGDAGSKIPHGDDYRRKERLY